MSFLKHSFIYDLVYVNEPCGLNTLIRQRRDVSDHRWSPGGPYLVVTVLLGEEEKTGADVIRVRGQSGDRPLLGGPPGRSISKAAEPLEANLRRMSEG